jgi:uncharacterized protein YdhG (YjbR/CyaY superfamily)
MRTSATIDDHLAGCTPSTRRLLQQLRRTIKAAAPGSTETIRYGIPTVQLNGKNLVHFAGYEHHIGFYPGSKPIEAFRSELRGYTTSRGTVQLPVDRPLPLALVKKMVRYAMDAMTPPDPFASLAAPARRALTRAGITSVRALGRKTQAEVAALHGMGPNAMKTLRTLLREHGQTFRRGGSHG